MGEKKATEDRGPLAFWLSQREEVCLGLVLIQAVKAETRTERRQKEAVLAALDLDWIEDVIDSKPISIEGSELAKVYDREIAGGAPRENAFVSVALAAFNVDKFEGRNSRIVLRRKEKLSRELAAWLLDKTEKIPAGGINDLLFSRIESRIADARNGDLKNWPPELVAPPAPTNGAGEDVAAEARA